MLRLFWVAMMACSTSLHGQDFVWTQTSAPSTNWQSVASSSDGAKLVAGSAGVYTSTNSGITWQQTSTPAVVNWYSVASSDDGSKLVAVAYAGGIYTSTNSGSTWTSNNVPKLAWLSVASSSDGANLVAAVNGGGIYTSTNSGSTWIKSSAPNKSWYSVASSFDGAKLVAAVHAGGIYTSTNSGATWTSNNVPVTGWFSVASSSDGSKLIAAGNTGGGIYISANSGATWSQISGFTVGWVSAASSSDGANLIVVAADTGAVVASTNSGVTWLVLNDAPRYGWKSIASSSDGTKLVAAVGGGIYTAYVPTNPPSITQQPLNLASCPGSPTVFGVIVAGTPPFAYQWKKNGTNLLDGGNVTGSKTNTLTLQSVSQSDSANYFVVITNAVGSVTSSVATLIVTSVPAKATPIIFNGFIVAAVLTDGGCGYTNGAAVYFNGQGGSGATGYVQISDGSATNIVITSAGVGYPTNASAQVAPPFYPTVSIALTNTPPATATPVIVNGFVVDVNLTATGSGYTDTPVVSFNDVTGTGATAYAQINSGAVTNIVISSAGSGYSANTVIHIPPAAYLNAVLPAASSLMLGQNYQLQIANDSINWTSFGLAFFATNNAWTPTTYWNLADTNQVFFRLQMLP